MSEHGDRCMIEIICGSCSTFLFTFKGSINDYKLLSMDKILLSIFENYIISPCCINRAGWDMHIQGFEKCTI